MNQLIVKDSVITTHRMPCRRGGGRGGERVLLGEGLAEGFPSLSHLSIPACILCPPPPHPLPVSCTAVQGSVLSPGVCVCWGRAALLDTNGSSGACKQTEKLLSRGIPCRSSG